MKLKKIGEWISRLYLLSSTALVCLFLIVILGDIVWKGAAVLNWDFVSKVPTHQMTRGGILPAITGTVLLTFITALCAIPLGVGCAIYLNEYAEDNWLTRVIRAAIRNLSGIPSIIYGLFGLALFVQALHLGTSLLAAGFTLGLLSLPGLITTTEEALKRVPQSMREGSLGLGTTQYESIRDVVLPSALPGIMTGVILTLSRAAGETAPILFTGVAFYINGRSGSLNQEFMALPYHLYMLSTQHQAIEQVRPLAYGTALVLIIVIFILNCIAFIIRTKHLKNNG